MREAILKRLADVQSETGTRILYACESGSRAWGFASTDSDYDVRFIFVHPAQRYLAIDDPADVIEKPIEDNIDLSGWELRKTLRLFRKCNPPLLEWLGSPIVYAEQTGVARRLKELAPATYSPIACAHHYLQMARGNCREYMHGQTVWRKKYFYVLRPILAILWIEAGKGVVPTEFAALADGLPLDTGFRRAIDALLDAKRAGAELDEGPRIPAISDFIERELARLESAQFPIGKRDKATAALDEIFRLALDEAWR